MEAFPCLFPTMSFLARTLQRILIFGLGVLCVWLIAFVIFDFADQRLPWAIAIAVTYGIGAYLIIPRAIRIGLRILRKQRVPRYTITGDGLAGDPVNLVLLGTYAQLRGAFAKLIGRRQTRSAWQARGEWFARS